MIRFVSASTQKLSSVSTITPPTVGSMSMWIQPHTSFVNNAQCLYIGGNFFVGTSNASVLQWRLLTNGTTASPTTLVLGTKYFWVSTWDSTTTPRPTTSSFINGATDVVSDTSKNAGTAAAAVFQIGGATNYTNTLIEDVRIYNRILTLAEIQTMYAAKGNDFILNGCLNRWLMRSEFAPGVAATGTGVVKDYVGGNHQTPTGSPLYQESVLKIKRGVTTGFL
jgi:hypothetical protein